MSNEHYRAILLIGPPGSGKGTQGRILGEVPGHYFLSMGEVLRSLDTGTQPGRQIHEHLRNGDLIPAELAISVWKEYMQTATGFEPRRDQLILDGLPRNVEQAQLLKTQVQVRRVIHLRCEDRALLIDRIRRRNDDRKDDTDDETIRHRFDVYRNQSAPLLDWYPASAIRSVDAARRPLDVLGQIVDALITC